MDAAFWHPRIQKPGAPTPGFFVFTALQFSFVSVAVSSSAARATRAQRQALDSYSDSRWRPRVGTKDGFDRTESEFSNRKAPPLAKIITLDDARAGSFNWHLICDQSFCATTRMFSVLDRADPARSAFSFLQFANSLRCIRSLLHRVGGPLVPQRQRRNFIAIRF